jgi:hypothetical protein
MCRRKDQPSPCLLLPATSLPAATIGSWIGGAICMATVYAFIYGKPAKALTASCKTGDNKTHSTAGAQQSATQVHGWCSGGAHNG